MRVPEQRDFPSRLHHPRVAAQLGAWLGICFFVAFATGLVSHLAQQPDSWLPESRRAGVTGSRRACTSQPAPQPSRC